MNKKLVMGVDESNHGRFPEIFVAVFSRLEKDILEKKFIKKRGNSNPLKSLGNRSYSFLQASKADYDRIPNKEFIGTIITSLFHEKKPNSFSNLELYIDGSRSPSQIIYTRDLLSETCEIPKDLISINHGPKYDQKYFIVNLADSIANHIFRHFSAKEMAYNPKYCNLIR